MSRTLLPSGVTIKVTITEAATDPVSTPREVEAARVVDSSWTSPDGWFGFTGAADILRFECWDAVEEAVYKWDPE